MCESAVVEAQLRCCISALREEMHVRLADALWDADTDAAAVASLEAIGAEMPPVTEGGREIATSTG